MTGDLFFVTSVTSVAYYVFVLQGGVKRSYPDVYCPPHLFFACISISSVLLSLSVSYFGFSYLFILISCPSHIFYRIPISCISIRRSFPISAVIIIINLGYMWHSEPPFLNSNIIYDYLKMGVHYATCIPG